MKAYVVKNKEGKYLSKYFNYNYSKPEEEYRHICTTKNILNAKLLDKKYECINDLDCVEITIAEGDLEKENRVLKSKLYEIWYNFATICEVCVTESKEEISSENAVEEIRNYLSNIDLCFDEIKEKLRIDYFIKQAKGEKGEGRK